MKILLAEVSKLLDEQGFERQGIEVQYCGERVGREWHDELVLVNEHLGISCKDYESADKTSVKYKDPEAKEKMVAAIRTLKESYRKYEQKIRDGKVDVVRRYFDRKRDDAERVARILEYRKFLNGGSV